MATTKNINDLITSQSFGWTDALLSRLAANSVGLGARLSITAPANASALSSTGYSLTGSNASSMIDLAGTWNTSGTPTLIKANVTDTASNAASLLMDLQVGGVSKLSLTKSSTLSGDASTGLTVNFGTLNHRSGTNCGYTYSGGHRLSLGLNGYIAWGTTNDTFAATGLWLGTDAANTLALRNAANAQAFNIYGTYTSASVYERGAVYADSNGFNIAHQQLGATKRPVRILGHNLASAEAVSALEINQTWNTTGNPVALKMAITNTASGATSKFLSFLAGASGTTEVFSVGKDGVVLGPNIANAFADTLETNSGFGFSSGNPLVQKAGTSIASALSSGWQVLALSLGATIGSPDTFAVRDAANTLALRNGANAQAFNVYNTYTSGSVYERGFIRWVSNVLEIGTEHVGASARDIVVKRNGVVRITLDASNFTTNGGIVLGGDIDLQWTSRVRMRSSTDSILKLSNNADNDFNRLQFGGTTSSFPSIKRSTTILQARLADDSDYATYQGKIQTHANATAETPTATHTITIYDASGTAYRVLCVV